MSEVRFIGPDSSARAGAASGHSAMELAATILSLGTNKLLARGSGWLRRRGLTRYVVPALLLNEAFGAYRAYVAAGAVGLW